MSGRPLVSVLLAAHNGHDFIRRALDSALAQTYSDLEVIVSENASTDDTLEIVASYEDPRVRIVSDPEPNLGAARNRGLRQARGPFLAMLDQDDYWSPNKLERQMPVLEAEADVGQVGSLMHWEGVDGRVLGLGGTLYSPEHQEQIARGLMMPFPISSTVFRTELLHRIGGFEEGAGFASDLDAVARVAQLARVAFVPEVLGACQIHGGSISDARFREFRVEVLFVQERLAAERRGEQLDWDEFRTTYRPGLRERWFLRRFRWFRAAGAALADRRYPRAMGYGALALVSSPLYTVGRLWRERVRPSVRSRRNSTTTTPSDTAETR